MNKSIYYFSSRGSEGDGSMHNILGGKGANLAQMCKLGLPIPPGFTIATSLCHSNTEKKFYFTPEFEREIKQHISQLEKDTKKDFGSNTNPLLLSVRSGAKVSMRGMMDTILNLGMNDEIARVISIKTKNPYFAYDTYRRFIEIS